MIATQFPVGVILCGGQSRRMGRDKTFLSWRGSSFLQAVVSALEPVCQRLVMVTAIANQPRPAVSSQRSLLEIVDQEPGAGPVAALGAALKFLASPCRDSKPGQSASEVSDPAIAAQMTDTHGGLFLAAVDSPGLQVPVVKYLLDRLAAQPHCHAVVPRIAPREVGAEARRRSMPMRTGGASVPAAFPLCAAYSQLCLEPLQAYYQAGGRSMHGLLEHLQVDWVSACELAPLDPAGLSFLNINTPSDYRTAVTIAGA